MISIHSLSELERLKLQETAYHELVARHFLSEFKPDRGEPARSVASPPSGERTPGRDGQSLGPRRVGGAPAPIAGAQTTEEAGVERCLSSGRGQD